MGSVCNFHSFTSWPHADKYERTDSTPRVNDQMHFSALLLYLLGISYDLLCGISIRLVGIFNLPTDAAAGAKAAPPQQQAPFPGHFYIPYNIADDGY